jgi:L-malate glycosyltransferase
MLRFRPLEIASPGSGEIQTPLPLPLLTKSIRVGFVMHKMQVAGAEVLVAEMIRQLKGRIEPTIFCLDAIGEIGEQLRDEGVRVVVLNRKPGRDWGVAYRLRDSIREHSIQVVHAHQYSPFFYAALAKILNRGRFKLIFTEHGRHYPDHVSPVRRAVNRLMLDHTADAVNAVCQFAADAVCKVDGFRGNRIEVIENGIDINRYHMLEEIRDAKMALGLDPTRRHVGLIARFHPVKDHPMAIQAFSRVAKQLPDVDLLLVGDGPDRPKMEALVGELDLVNRVQFLGIRRDIPRILQALDLFLLTSVSEAASLTLMEAMAAGRPVVVTEVGGNPEIIRDGQEGFLVPRGDHLAAASKIIHILQNPTQSRMMGQAAWRRARDLYDLNKTIRRYHSLYRRLIGQVICDD